MLAQIRASLAAASDLQHVTTSATATGPMDSPESTADRADAFTEATVLHTAIAGRETELLQLENAFDEVVSSGAPGLAVIAADVGMGKTTLCPHLATHVAMRGGRTLLGHCYEEGSPSLPYMPFVEAFRGYVRGQTPLLLRKQLGPRASDLARLVPEICDRIPIEPRQPQAGDPHEERSRLFQAVTGFLGNIAGPQPLLVVLEDLQWADRSTLDLLAHVVRQLSGLRILILGTYLDSEVQRGHPLTALLADFSRVKGFTRLTLRGLDAAETQRMLQLLAGGDPPRSFAEAVEHETEGNPLFVQEMTRYFLEEGLITRDADGGTWAGVATGSVLTGMPHGLREVVGRRIALLKDDCQRVLSMAAVIGREFTSSTLQLVARLPDEGVLRALEDGVRAGVIREESRQGRVQYRFANAFSVKRSTRT